VRDGCRQGGNGLLAYLVRKERNFGQGGRAATCVGSRYLSMDISHSSV
jgi:hypothetical protein